MYLAKDKIPTFLEILVGINFDPEEQVYYFKTFLKDNHSLKVFQIVKK